MSCSLNSYSKSSLMLCTVSCDSSWKNLSSTAAGKFCKPSLSVASLLPSLDNSQLPVFDLRCSLLAHYCGQLICQNFVLALSRRSSKRHGKFSVRASTTGNFPCLLSSLPAQKSRSRFPCYGS